jgi:prepilin-type N-terminal cleavage/methylation domain-containing protein
MKRPAANNHRPTTSNHRGFTVVEVVISLIILGLICSSVMLVVKRGMVTLGDSRLRMEAFEVARENMENLLTASSVSEMDDYGVSDKNPNIEWETVVEPFTDPATHKMWVQAVCSATYPDANGQPQKLELTHWLTDVPDNVRQQMLDDKEKLKDANEPNSVLDANGLPGMPQIPGNTQLDPELQKLLEPLQKE